METKKLFYKIKEVAEMLGEAQSTIRFWEEKFDYLSPQKSTTGIRYYKTEDIERLKTVQHLLREQKLTIPGAIEQLKGNKRQRHIDNAKIANELKKIREEIMNIKKSLTNSFPDSDNPADYSAEYESSDGQDSNNV